ncbi:solute carrier family 17 protein [Skeletonema marinoi]|uniref:Solute carrier family 17 protein n=1 Tax=Skeletonema marinoi TaxID=267567 RepID=A0AAD8XZG8_9STRA|nr:solute carrier family 17 protein [Skeletonema marinoi]
MKTPSPPILPPRALHWSIAASTAAAISYADRGTSAIAASSLLDELHWNESQLGQVQSAFFVGYALTQVFGGVLGGRSSSSTTSAKGSYNSIAIGSGSSDNDYYGKDKDAEETKLLNINNSNTATAISSTTQQQQQQKRQEGYRRILPLSLVLTGITTILFPMAAMAGPNWAILDRFSLGLLEGVLLPAAMAGVSSTTTTTTTTTTSSTDGIIVASDTTTTTSAALERHNSIKGKKDIKATASAIVIAGCYLGSAWAYLSAWIIFSETSQVHLAQWGFLQQDSASASVWPLLFYINGILSLFITGMFSSEFDLSGWRNNGSNNSSSSKNNTKRYDESTDILSSSAMVIMKDVITIAKETLSAKSGRAIVAAQIGQGALLYSIASWGPLYLERIADVSTTTATAVDTTSSLSFVSSTAVAASIAASSLIVPQITQALIGMSIGVGADKLSATIGSRLTRRSLQFISGVGPAMILVYLSLLTSDSNSGDGTTFQSPAFLFGVAQTISAISLGAVSVSHLEVATPSKSGAVYALGNVFAAISGSITVTLFGVLLDKDGQQQAATTTAASDFSLPFQIVAILSAVGSIFYSLSIESDLEIGMQETKKDHQSKSR